jgi:hypothetical protein
MAVATHYLSHRGLQRAQGKSLEHGSFEPFTQNLCVRRVLSDKLVQVNKHMLGLSDKVLKWLA